MNSDWSTITNARVIISAAKKVGTHADKNKSILYANAMVGKRTSEQASVLQRCYKDIRRWV